MILIKKKRSVYNRNLGIEILRMILCFWVLSFHCLNKDKINYVVYYFTKTKFYHVPCFSFISFYYSSNIFLERNVEKIKRRLERLLIPYIIWPLLVFTIDNSLHLIFSAKIQAISFRDLQIQFIVGRQFMVPLWFLFGMVIQSILFFIISNIFKKYFLLITQLLIIFSYIIEYNNQLTYFNKYKNNVKLPILDTFSILPLSLLGLNIASLNIMTFFKNNLRTSFIFIYLMLYFFFRYEIFIDLGGYKGIAHIFISFLLFIGFYILPLENSYFWFQKYLKQMTSFTNGIYCLQTKIIHFVVSYIDTNGTFKSSLISYILLYFISFISMKIVGNTKFKYLFI